MIIFDRTFSERAVLEDSHHILSNLKLRLSYGKTGDDRVAAFQYLTGYNYPGSASYIFGSNVVKSVVSKGLPNEQFTWFTSEIFNGGIDAAYKRRSLFDYFEIHRIRASIKN